MGRASPGSGAVSGPHSVEDSHSGRHTTGPPPHSRLPHTGARPGGPRLGLCSGRSCTELRAGHTGGGHRQRSPGRPRHLPVDSQPARHRSVCPGYTGPQLRPRHRTESSPGPRHRSHRPPRPRLIRPDGKRNIFTSGRPLWGSGLSSNSYWEHESWANNFVNIGSNSLPRNH